MATFRDIGSLAYYTSFENALHTNVDRYQAELNLKREEIRQDIDALATMHEETNKTIKVFFSIGLGFGLLAIGCFSLKRNKPNFAPISVNNCLFYTALISFVAIFIAALMKGESNKRELVRSFYEYTKDNTYVTLQNCIDGFKGAGGGPSSDGRVLLFEN